MTARNAPPRAAALIESLRGLGYTVATALADIVDNSISAGAGNVDIHFHWDKGHSWVRVLDDGAGMSDPELETAMQLGAKDPREARAETDLGRFGMGLKTASFSQARRLTVASRKEGFDIACLRWDLDRLSEGDGDWTLLEGPDPEGAEALTPLERQTSGTVVLWEKLDRIVSEGFNAEDLFELMDGVQTALAMTFHRLLAGPDPVFTLRLNGRAVTPWDPFLSGDPRKAWESPLYRLPGPHGVRVQCHVLPHKDMMTAKEAEAAGGPAGWSSQQGFYIYRNRRLLVAGGWLRLGERGRTWTKDEPYRLARIMIDIPNAADAEWKINVLKSTASPPVSLRLQLRRLGTNTRERARRVFAHRGRLVPASGGSGGGLPDAWMARKGPKGTSYRISREHDLVASVLQRAGPLRRDLEAMLRLIEETVPVQRIWLDTAEDKETPVNDFIESADDDVREVLEVMFETLTKVRGFDAETARSRLLRTAPFDQYPLLIAELR
jgi:anti-sigma regulatory factor (Ser/Thr protein kinase)